MEKKKVNNIIKFLNDDSCGDMEKPELTLLIKNVFDLTENQAKKVYRMWKCQYMKPKAD